MYKEMHEILNECHIGEFKLSKFEITRENRPFRCDIPVGKYIRLIERSFTYVRNKNIQLHY